MQGLNPYSQPMSLSVDETLDIEKINKHFSSYVIGLRVLKACNVAYSEPLQINNTALAYCFSQYCSKRPTSQENLR